MKLEQFYYGFALLLSKQVERKSVTKEELKAEINRIIDEVFKLFE